MSNIHITDENQDHKYFSILQNILSRIGLTAFERSVYWAIKECAGEKGSCTKSYAKIAVMAGLSERSLKRTLETLSQKNKILKKPLIQIKNRLTEYGDRDTNEIVLVSLWADNFKFFQKEIGGATQTSPGVRLTPPQVTQTPGVGPHSHHGGATQAYKEEPIKKNLYEEEQQQAAAVFFDCLTKDTRLTKENREALIKFSEERIKLAQEYSYKVEPTKGLIQQLIWHCKLKEPPKIPKKSFWDAVRDHFQNQKKYNSATCYINSEEISFERGMTHLAVKFAEAGAKEKFNKHISQFGIKWSYDE